MRSLKQELATKSRLFGTFCALGNVDAVELACHAGFDFVIVDGQHGTFDGRGLREALRAIQATGCFPIVRPPVNGFSVVEGLLDIGYPAMLVPMVNTLDQAKSVVRAVHYPPMGQRSLAPVRAHLHHGPTYRQEFNQDFTLLVMIEHIDAVQHVEQIASLPGVSGCFIGPTDLASSMTEERVGEMEQVIERVRAATAAAGKIAGIATPSVDAARRYAAQGFQFITVTTDRRLLSDALSQVAGACQERIA